MTFLVLALFGLALSLTAVAWVGLRLARLEAELPPTAPPPRWWEWPLIRVGEALQDLHGWWAYTCVDCKQNFGSSAGLTRHIIDRTYCTVEPALPRPGQ